MTQSKNQNIYIWTQMIYRNKTDKTEIKLLIFYNILIGNVKKLVPNFFGFLIKKSMCFIKKTYKFNWD